MATTSAKKYIARVKRCLPIERAALQTFKKVGDACLDRGDGLVKCHAKARKAYLARLGKCRGVFR